MRIRVEETYTDPIGYTLKNGELELTRTLGRPLNYVTLPGRSDAYQRKRRPSSRSTRRAAPCSASPTSATTNSR